MSVWLAIQAGYEPKRLSYGKLSQCLLKLAPFGMKRLLGKRLWQPRELPPVPQEDGDLDEPPFSGLKRDKKSRSRSPGPLRDGSGRSGHRVVGSPPSSWRTPQAPASVKVAGGDRWRKSKTVGEPSEGALQREIEKSMVEHLALENRQLREELAKVKQDANGSQQSWSEVSAAAEGRQSEGRMPMSAGGAKTEGPEPGGDEKRSVSVERRADEPEAQRFTPGVGGPGWTNDQVMNPEQARLAWLEREMLAMQSALVNLGPSRLSGQYWGQPVHRWDRDEGVQGFGGLGDVRAGNGGVSSRR